MKYDEGQGCEGMIVKIVCCICGHEMIPIIYPTNPPKYGNKCINCGREVKDEVINWSGGQEPIQIIGK